MRPDEAGVVADRIVHAQHDGGHRDQRPPAMISASVGIAPGLTTG